MYGVPVSCVSGVVVVGVVEISDDIGCGELRAVIRRVRYRNGGRMFEREVFFVFALSQRDVGHS